MEVRHLRLNVNMIELGWSNATLAVAASKHRHKPVSRQYISQLRNGHRKTCEPMLATAMAAVMGVPLDELFIPRTSSTRRAAVQKRTKVPAAKGRLAA